MLNQRKKNLYILFFAFLVSLGIFRLLVFLMMAGPNYKPPTTNPDSIRPIIYIIAGLCLLASAVWTTRAVRAPQSFAKFQTNIILGLAISEACTIFGLMLFIMGGSAGEFNSFPIASAAVDLLFILPHVLRRSGD